MLQESIIIKNFGPLSNVNLSAIRRFNVFIGESGSGKSTIMKALAMMRWIYKMCCVRTYFSNSGIQVPFRFRIDAILSDNGLKDFLRNDSEINYCVGSFNILLKNGKLVFPQKLVDISELTLQKVSYISDKRNMIPDLAAGNVAIRHGMLYLDETFLNYQKAIEAIPESDMKYLGVKLTAKKNGSGRKLFVSSIDKDNPFSNLPIISASSGLQNSVALHFIVHYFSKYYDIVESMNSTIVRYLAAGDNLSKFSADFNIGMFPNRRISLHIEEPELSLFPSNQWGLMRYLIEECLNAEMAEMDMTIATHSPYIITALNVMTLAHKAFQKDPDAYAGLNLNIPLIDFRNIGAWSVETGVCHDLMDDNLGLIDGTHLDSTSDVYEDLILKLNEIVYG